MLATLRKGHSIDRVTPRIRFQDMRTHTTYRDLNKHSKLNKCELFQTTTTDIPLEHHERRQRRDRVL